MSKDKNKYYLHRHIIGSHSQIKITKEQYEACQEAVAILDSSFNLEELYEVLLYSYTEYEKFLLSESLERSICYQNTPQNVLDLNVGINARVVGFLAIADLYLDRLPHMIQKCNPDEQDIVPTIKNICSQKYDSQVYYRFMSKLRNHSVHYALPVSWISTLFKHDPLDGGIEFSITPAAQRSVLEKNPGFKRAILKEVDEKVDFKKAIRTYMECISDIHTQSRNLVIPFIANARKTVEQTLELYPKNKSRSGLKASIFPEGRGKPTSSIPLSLEWDDLRIQLQKKNVSLVNLSKRYVTGKVKSPST